MSKKPRVTEVRTLLPPDGPPPGELAGSGGGAPGLLDQELDHRIKNVFAVVSALITLSARRHPEAEGFAADLKARVQALARAHEFVRPHTASAVPGGGPTTLHAFLRALLAPYDRPGEDAVRIEGEDVVFDDQAATPVALLFHELATNAARHGALSRPGGRVTISTDIQPRELRLAWLETGGPAIEAPPSESGFGLTLAALAVEGQLAGRLDLDWKRPGLEATAALPVAALQRRRLAAGGAEPEAI